MDPQPKPLTYYPPTTHLAHVHTHTHTNLQVRREAVMEDTVAQILR